MDIAKDAKVHARVYIGQSTDPTQEGLGLRAEIDVEGCDDDAIIHAANEVSVILDLSWRSTERSATVKPIQSSIARRHRSQGFQI